MSPGALLQAAIVARLRGEATLGELAVFDAPPVRVAMPCATVDAPLLADASAAGVAGRTGRIAITLRDRGERPVRLRAFVGIVESAVEALSPDLGEGWRLVAATLARGRITQTAPSEWSATSEFAVALYRQQS